MVCVLFFSGEFVFYLFRFFEHGGIFFAEPGEELSDHSAFRRQDEKPDYDKQYSLENREEKADYAEDEEKNAGCDSQKPFHA